MDLGWRLLDAYSPTLLRADMHIGERRDTERKPDCLHYCVVGSIIEVLFLEIEVLADVHEQANIFPPISSRRHYFQVGTKWRRECYIWTP